MQKASDFCPKKNDLFTLEMLVFEARVAGGDFDRVYDYTFGELLELIEVNREKERRKNKSASIVAYSQSYLICDLISNGGNLEVYKVFPFWTEEEVAKLELDKFQRTMKEQALKGR